MPGIFEELRVWQEARKLAKEIYMLTDAFPANEMYGITGQMRRAAVSVMSNIVEGQGRFSKQEFVRFLFIARGSLMEVNSLCILAGDLELISSVELEYISGHCDKIGKMINVLISKTQLQIKNQKDKGII
ncbi:MAG: four helix bundle protein [bacterium]|nr:four helix bundle protein [bacterium]